MNKEKIGFTYKKKKIFIDVEIVPRWKKGIGLMFSRREKAKNLLFGFSKPTKIKLHSWFVFFPFVAIWFDNKNKIIKIEKVLPWEAFIGPKKPFKKVIEIPLNKKNKNILRVLVG